MKYLYITAKSLFIILLITFFYDISIYQLSYDGLINNIDYIKKTVSHELGISENLKKNLASKEIFIDYEKSFGDIGELFSFEIYKKTRLTFNKNKEIKIKLVVLLGY